MAGSFFLAATGVREAQAFFSEVDLELKRGLRGRLKEAAQLVAEEMKARTHSRRVRAAVGYDIEIQSLVEYRAKIGPERRRAFFAHFLEFGTEHSRAFPFAEPALEATEERVVDIVGLVPQLA